MSLYRIPADIKDATFCVGVKNSNDSLIFKKMFELYLKSKSISEKMSFGLALGCSTNRTELTEYVYKVKNINFYGYVILLTKNSVIIVCYI